MSNDNNGTSKVFFTVFFFMLAAAVIGIAAWMLFSYPRMSKVCLEIDRSAAQKIAKEYLRKQFGVNPLNYQSASVFFNQENVDTFLQRVLGTQGELEFLRKYDYDLFYWKVRFFRPGEKEEYLIYISSKTGEVIQYKHLIEETAAREEISKDKARKIAEKFLVDKAGVKLEDFVIKDETRETVDKRVEYGFYWRHKDVDITWNRLPNGGKAKLLTGALVTGNEVRCFYKMDLSVPEEFSRFLDKEMEVGRNLSLVFTITYILIVVVMIVQLINCRQHLALRTVKPVVVRIGILLGTIAILSSMNHSESTLMNYPTSQELGPFLWRSFFTACYQSVLPSIALIMMALAAEAVHAREPLSSDGRGSFLYYARSSFMTRNVTASLIYGCLLACILLGVQSLIFAWGERYCGLWTQTPWLTEFSSSYWPFLAAIFIGLRASLLEEIIFRMFAIHWLNYKLKNLILAVIIASVFWGFGHTGYQVFPMWFRGVEITLLGFIFSWAYLRFGILTVLVAHYLFDAFWASSGSLFNPSAPRYFWSAIAVLSLPLFWAAMAWVSNRPSVLRPLNFNLNPAQQFHLQVLEAFVERSSRTGADLANLKRLCLKHSWDPAVVEKAFGSGTGDSADSGTKNCQT